MYKYFVDISNDKSIEIDFVKLYYFMPILIESTTIYEDMCYEKHYVRGIVNIDDEYEMKLVKELNKWENDNL